ncbi:MAG: DUF4355 domain-containing protein [Enterococcus faecalis]
MKTKKLLLPMYLQFFADNSDTGAGDTDQPARGQEQTPPGDNNKDTGNEKTFSRDEVAKMIAAEVSKAKDVWEKDQQKKQEEAEKLAKMNAQEKADYEKQQLEAKLAEYERKEVLSKMSEQASEMLSEKGAKPTKDMLRLIVSEDAETTSSNVKTYLASINSEREAIKSEYEKRLRGKIPLGGDSAENSSYGDYGKRLAQKAMVEKTKQTYFKN